MHHRILERPVNSSLRSPRQCAVAGRLANLTPVVHRHRAVCNAVRESVEPVNFGEVYLAMQERVVAQGTLPKGDGLVLVASIRSVEHAQRTLQLIARHVASKRQTPGALELDWPTRKKWLSGICELALVLPGARPLVMDVFANAEVFALSKYFAAEVVELLAAQGAETALLVRVVDLFRSRRLPGCKGVAAAYHRLLEATRRRREEEATQAVSATLKKYMEVAPPVPVPVPPAGVAVAGPGVPVPPAGVAVPGPGLPPHMAPAAGQGMPVPPVGPMAGPGLPPGAMPVAGSLPPGAVPPPPPGWVPPPPRMQAPRGPIVPAHGQGPAGPVAGPPAAPAGPAAVPPPGAQGPQM